MKFAAGITVTGILTLLVLEALKVVMVPLAAWIVGLLALLFKVVLVVMGLATAAAFIGLAVFLYKRFNRSKAEV